MKKILTAIIILASVFITACDHIALGTALNLNGPVVEILGPVSKPGQTDPEVGTLFNFWGTASSDSTVARMTITLTYFNRASNKMVLMGREWQWEGSWQIRESSSLPWRPYTQSVYASDYEEYKALISSPSWDISGKTVNWKLPIYMNRMEKGQFFITVTAWDNVGNSDSNSSKRIKVEFSNDSPTLKIDLPLTMDGEGALEAPKPPNFTGTAYKFDPFGDPNQTYENRSNFINKFRDFRWTADHSATLKRLVLEITNEHNLDTIGGDPRKKTYFHGEYENIDFNTSSGSTRTSKGNHIDDGQLLSNNGTSYTKISNAIVFDQEEFIEDILALPNERITPLQVVSTLEDEVGKKEYKSKGWFLWLPDSDKPFVDITFGFKVKDGAVPPSDAPDRAIITRGTKTNRITFYDDKEGVKSAVIKLTRLRDNSLEDDHVFAAQTIDFGDDQQTNFTHNFVADFEYGVGRYKMEVRAKDYGTSGNNGIEGDLYIAYFTIVSNTAPEILAWPDTLADADGGMHKDTIWGNSSGDIDFWGEAAIEGDTAGTIKVNRVTVVLLNYEQGAAQGAANSIRFTDPAYSGWNTGTEAGFTDSFGNKIWEIPAGNINIISGMPGSNLGDGQRDVYKFSKTLNWFNDLNGKTSTKNKNLIVRALSRGALNREYYSTKTITIHGDNTQPTVEVTALRVEARPNASSNYSLVKEYDLRGKDSLDEMLQAITLNNRIMLKGTWNDDSASKWTNVTINGVPLSARDLFSSVSVRWEGTGKQYDLVLNTVNGSFTNPTSSSVPGNWETDFFSGFPDSGNADPLVTLAASFEDLGGNPGKNNKVVTIETDTPTLSRVSSDVDNGRYGPNKNGGIIEIFLGFNKAIFLESASSTIDTTGLSLQLSNGATATYARGLGAFVNNAAQQTPPASERIVFTYNISNGSETGNDRLNVVGINWGNATQSKWKSINGSAVIFPSFVITQPGTTPHNTSLAGQKNIVIDRTAPAVTSITTTTANGRVLGKGQQMNFIVEFNEDVDILQGATLNNIRLLLASNAGTLSNNVAAYSAKAGAKSLMFSYSVADGDNTDGTAVRVSNASGFDNIVDKALNKPVSSPTNVPNLTLGRTVTVDTIPPAAPVISSSSVVSGRTSYGDVIVNVSGIETGARWEYNTNYANNPTIGWISRAAGSSSTSITLSTNGSYSIAARQYDTASPENASPVSDVYSFTIDKGPILTKITSPNASGEYGFGVSGKGSIDIDLEFRIPVTFGSGAQITINTNNNNKLTLPTTTTATGSINRARITYTIADGVSTPTSGSALDQLLNVTALDFINNSNVTVTDSSGTDIKSFISLTGTFGVSTDNLLNRQKEIKIIAGRPTTANTNLGTLQSGTESVWFNGDQLGIKFDRNIFRGSTTNKLIIRQIETDYRIPAVLSEQRFTDLFSGREDMFVEQSSILDSITAFSGTNANKATLWKQLGDFLYQKGSNGATSVGDSGLVTPDTTTKYVLRFTVDTITGTSATLINNITGVGSITSISMANLTQLFRAAEALTFDVNDPKIDLNTSVFTVDLMGSRALPVVGASYEWIFPNGFVVDSLGRQSGSTAGNSGTDANLSSNGTTRRLNYTNTGTGKTTLKVENPIIRIDKGDDGTYFGVDGNGFQTQGTLGANRQARQKLVTQVKMDCRTPGAAITYRSRSNSDNVRTLMYRNGGTVPPASAQTGNTYNSSNVTPKSNLLPNLGEMANTGGGVTNNRASWENTRMRPQSGTAGKTAPSGGWGTGLDYYASLTGSAYIPDAPATYSAPITIGEYNYNTGGQEFNYRARATLTGLTQSDYSFEAAYRSVLVFANAYINTGKTGWDNGLSIGGANNRLWVRGSNTVQGDPTIADFPISRDASLYRKVKLMTPITPPNASSYTADTILNDSNIVPNTNAQLADGYYLWFWVTWKINVPAFIDLQVGTLPADDVVQAPTSMRKYFQAYIPSVEHYAVHPGRTTIMEARDSYRFQWDGEHGPLLLTSAVTPPAARD